MKINSIKIAKLYSFGPEQELNDLSYFNLFIGKNGSGKTNIFKILKEIPFEYRSVGSLKTQFKTFSEKVEHFENDVFKPFILVGDDLRNGFQRGVWNNDSFDGNFKGILKIDYEELEEIVSELEETVLKNTVLKNKVILFQDDDFLYADDVGEDFIKTELYFRFVEGDIHNFQKKVAFLQIPQNEDEFYKHLALFIGSKGKDYYLPILNFGLFYIFELYYIFFPNGTFCQGKHLSGGKTEEETSDLPSGVANCAKILTSIFMASLSTVILLDEPELHLEPRVVRRLFKFLFWFLIREKPDKNAEEETIFNQVEMVLQGYTKHAQPLSKLTDHHPNEEYKQKQLFIASHSPMLINEFISLNSLGSIYEFDSKFTQIKKRKMPSPIPGVEDTETRDGTYSTVRKIDSDALTILDNLGVKGSDILQTNGVIWVEGPSDVVYLKKWLSMFAKENKTFDFLQGINYEFQMFGGTLLDSLCLIKEGLDEGAEYKKLVEMFSFSRNAFIVIDSDAVKNADGDIIDKSKFKNAKMFVRSQLEELLKENYKLGLWYKEGETDIRTMEDYLDNDSTAITAATKKLSAQKRVESWGQNKTLKEFPNDLEKEVAILYETIASWNN
jgi:energy-coupling factor transporter ATP-binding protein EcfA2